MTGGGDTHQHPDAANPGGQTRFMRAAGERRRQGIAVGGMPMASDVVVRSLDGTVLRVVPAQVDQARRPAGEDVAPLPPRAEPQPEPVGPAYSFMRAFRYAQVQADLPITEGLYGGFTAERFAEMVGTSQPTVQKWRDRGWIPRDAADGVAIALGVHPVMLWPEWLTDGLAEADRFDSEPEVRRQDRARRLRKGWDGDEPTGVDWRGERRRRREAERKREQYRQDEAYRADQIAKSRARYERNREPIRAQRKTYRQANKRAITEAQTRYNEQNADAIKARQTEYRNRPEVREKRRLAAKARYARQRDRLLEQQRARDRAKAAAKRAAKEQGDEQEAS